MRRLPRWAKICASCAAAVAALGIGAWLARAPLLRAAGGWLDVGETPRPADLVMLLPGDPNTRAFAAAALVKTGYAPRAVTSHEMPSPSVLEGAAIAGDEMARRVFVARGVAPEAISVLPGESRSTFDDAAALAKFLGSEPARSVIVVTNDFHSRRARWVFRKALGRRAGALRFVTVPVEGIDSARWWRTEDGAVLYASEYLKLVFYFFRYGSGWAWLAGGGAAAIAGMVIARRRWARRHPAPASAAPNP